MEQQGQPFDFLLYATLTSGTTRVNKDYQRDYLLTLEMVNLHNGEYDKQSATLTQGLSPLAAVSAASLAQSRTCAPTAAVDRTRLSSCRMSAADGSAGTVRCAVASTRPSRQRVGCSHRQLCWLLLACCCHRRLHDLRATVA